MDEQTDKKIECTGAKVCNPEILMRRQKDCKRHRIREFVVRLCPLEMSEVTSLQTAYV